ncbi:MAG: hypothetical protein ACQBVK_00380 [Candidatus Phytoplasma sp. TWB_XP]
MTKYSKYSRRSFRRNKLTLTGFLTRWILPTLGIVIPFCNCLRFKRLFDYK